MYFTFFVDSLVDPFLIGTSNKGLSKVSAPACIGIFTDDSFLTIIFCKVILVTTSYIVVFEANVLTENVIYCKINLSIFMKMKPYSHDLSVSW